ncbi:ubiquitin carboxyl-terminal hydrolase 27 [Malania oleifera]|uniref:ubiquitin carboxyl-terminal hydrolase 27 n=1 Tax=Malania oleifera TaxID=397392 RepID=UPI0025AEC7A6|nr:ubiquitin carboxyl-terminal hydrolase 27 [Malania oleifera]
MNWVSISKLPISIAAILGIAGLILALRDAKTGNLKSLSLPWSSERESSSERFCFVPGLRNLGNNCFLNVILQALASCICFRRYIESVLEKNESSSVEEQVESLPLTLALAALMKDLCALRDRRMTLNPRKVMLAMDSYIPSFNLTSQQDAAEAFLHLLSSLREEFSECYVPNCSSLADISVFTNNRILTMKRREEPSEQDRWQQHFIGPFDGILGSILTCQSCSFQISLDYEFFHSLPLPLMHNRGGTILAGCTLEDCLKRFVVAEQLENYHCSHCWHIAAVKYLSSLNASETEIEKLRSCNEDSCCCRSVFHLEALPWSNSFSRTYKQLVIACCPKILCIHLQRASMNEFGELVKVQGHISFPLILNLLPFVKSGVGIKKWEENLQAKRQSQPVARCPNHFNVQLDGRMISSIFGPRYANITSEAMAAEELGSTAVNPTDGTCNQAFQGEHNLPQTEGCSVIKQEHMNMEPKDEVSKDCRLAPSATHMYHLVSVVEHFGRAGSGHYTVYRRVAAELNNDNCDGQFWFGPVQWFCISDSEVYPVSEEDVLAAEASLLFYERVGG